MRTEFQHYAEKSSELVSYLSDGRPDDECHGVGLCVETHQSRSVLRNGFKENSYIIMLVWIKEEDLKDWANLKQTDLLISKCNAIKKGRDQGFPLAHMTGLPDEKPDLAKKIKLNSWDYYYVHYSSHANEQVYNRYLINPDSKHSGLCIFPKKVQLRLIWEKLVAHCGIGGADIPVGKLLKDKNHPLLALFPLHTQVHRKWLDENWLRKWDLRTLLRLPLDDIRDYFNEPIAFYFGFVHYYQKWLVLLSIVATAWFVLMQWSTKTGFVCIEGFLIFLSLWSVCFVDFWKRRQNQLAMRWGMHRFCEKEPIASFQGGHRLYYRIANSDLPKRVENIEIDWWIYCGLHDAFSGYRFDIFHLLFACLFQTS